MNKKVYIATDHLASRFDIEYVKSHLLRIPNIVLVDETNGYNPSECEAMVVIPNSGYLTKESVDCYISKKIHTLVMDFIRNSECSALDALDYLYFYIGKEINAFNDDVEDDTPLFCFVSSTPYGEDEKDWNYYSKVSVNPTMWGYLLPGLAGDIDEDSRSWRKIKRYHTFPQVSEEKKQAISQLVQSLTQPVKQDK